MARSKARGRKKPLRLNFEGVESGGRVIPDGKYLAEIVGATPKEGEDSGKPFIEWQYKLLDGPGKGAKVFDNTSLQPQALWRLRTLLECIGYEFPEEGTFDFEPSDVFGEQLVIEITNEEYEGRSRPRVTAYGAPGTESDEGEEDEDEGEEEDEDEEPPAKKKGRKGKSKPPPEEEEDEDEGEEEDEDEDEEPPPKRSRKKRGAAKTPALKVGSKVSFEDEGKTYKGKVTELDDDGTVTVDVKGDEWQVDAGELTAL